eukprot:scaffold21950_cov59-Phaeocystis_antarctica.AAC.1
MSIVARRPVHAAPVAVCERVCVRVGGEEGWSGAAAARSALAHWVGEEAAGLCGGGVELQRGERAVQLAVVQLARAVAVEAHERGEHVGIDGGGSGGGVLVA